MKPLRYIKLLFALALGMLCHTSCNDWLDDNINPDLTTENPPALLLSSAEAQLGFHMGSDLLRYSALWSQQIAAQNGRQTEAYDLYILQPTEVNNAWRAGFYAGVLKDIEEILSADPSATHPRYYGIAKILKAFSYSILIDYWGDVPFSQAMQGSANAQPDIDNDEVVYPQLITLIDDGIADLNRTSIFPAPGAEDYFYGGSVVRWTKMANTLKLRLYLHMVNLPASNAQILTTINSFLTNTPATNFMESATDDFQMRFEAAAQRQNPTHQFILNRTNDICTSATIINLMNTKTDPRRAVYFTPAPFSPALLENPPSGIDGYTGLTNGTGATLVRNNLSRLHTFVRGAVTSTSIPAGPNLTVSGATSLSYAGNAPQNILTFAEYNFMRAEFALRYGMPGVPQDFYRAGITASFVDAGLAATAATYITTPAGTLTGTTEDQLRQIIEEKYVANFMVAGEPWSDWRRTGYPALSTVPASFNPGNGGQVPRVQPYPQQEVDSNPKLLPLQQLRATDRSAMAVRVFWDTRP